MGQQRPVVAVADAPPVELPNEEYPFAMNTGRQLYHWHTCAVRLEPAHVAVSD